ncbi:hypothetical protein BaRGS_00007229 [Batillaria attramentaria]|uniref:Uncharacterized protein n=1 Tax=Batillaria attramentaria TaxID=370345 RepID=A0ABD0LPF9_9CAEN
MNTISAAIVFFGVAVIMVTGDQCSFGGQCSSATSKADVNGVTFCCLSGAVSLTIVNGQPECSCSGSSGSSGSAGSSDTVVIGGGQPNEPVGGNNQPPSPSGGKTVDDFGGNWGAYMADLRNSGGSGGRSQYQYDYYGRR